MIARRAWLLFVAVAGAGGAALLAVIYSFVPVVDDVVDPLGRPSNLANSVIFSASEFDRITGVLVPKHVELTDRIGVLSTVANSLDGVVAKAGDLTPLAVAANDGTGHVVGVAQPLPDLVGQITSRSKEATGAAGDLDGALVELTGGLQGIGGGLGTIHGTLTELGPKGRDIADTLAQIERESQRVKPLGPTLGRVSQLTHG